MDPYCSSIFTTKRWKTREVMIGNVGIGGHNPVRIQSMTTSNTRDVEATIAQIMRLSDAGCDMVRVTVQGMKEAEACEGIKNGLIQRGYLIPVIADIHFFPPAAMKVIDFVDKVRINPGNFVDKRASFKILEYDDVTYSQEIKKIEEKFTPLVEKCKLLKKAMRIGTNHGSLSDRIMNRYGDSPQGMVESALEFARICRHHDYHNFLFSMKSSNPQVMIQAYRLLVSEMIKIGWNYPLHLGVTEAGEGEDGRIKSAMGIGSLLLDGIGDTIRVSLTEDAWNEIDPCKRLVDFGKSYIGKGISAFTETFRNIFAIQKRAVTLPKNIAMHRDGTVIVSLKSEDFHDQDLQEGTLYKKLGCDVQFGKPKLKVSSADGVILKGSVQHDKIAALKEMGMSIFCGQEIPMFSVKEAHAYISQLSINERFAIHTQRNPFSVVIDKQSCEEWILLKDIQPAVIFLSPPDHRLHYCRQFFDWLQKEHLQIPVILGFQYTCSKEDLIIHAAAEYGALLCDGLGDGIWIDAPYELDFLRSLSFSILQAARMRSSKTDFISCPSCGRTLFNLQDVSKKIRSRTSHLPGVKIAIMGCIVNGPGEMADADFGYVGSKPGMIDLYVGKECIEKDISFADADDRLIDLIKKHGRWIEPDIKSEVESEVIMI